MKSQQKQSPASRIAELEKELEIEAAMDRIRARAMAMHSSGELVEVADVLRVQMGLLGQPDLETTAVQLYDDNSDIFESLYAFRPSYGPEGKSISASTTFPTDSCELVREMMAMYQSPATDYTLVASGAKRQEWFEVLQKAAPEIVKYAVANEAAFPETTYFHFSDFRGGTLLTVSYQPPSKEVKALLRRAASVFDLAYRRFTDLKKAEAQTREAQIELSLERVRAKTMAMHNSEDVGATVAATFDELVKLGVDKTTRCGIGIIHDTKQMEVWTATSNANLEVVLNIGTIDMMAHPLMVSLYDQWKAKKEHYTYLLLGEEVKNYYRAVNDTNCYKAKFDIDALPSKQINNCFIFPEGALYTFSPEPLTAEVSKIVKRFSGVFGQTYRRYLDLQKAEAQARQAQIEVAMEKVRSRSLAMQKPGELGEVAQVLRQEMALLGVEELETSSIYIRDDNTGKTECWFAIKDEHKLVADHMDMNLKDTWVGRQMLKFYHSGKTQISIPMKGENRKEWINYCSTKSQLLDGYYGDNIPDRTYHLCKFSAGYMGAASPGDISAESWGLLKRAVTVVSFAYTRFSDLQQAQAQVREAQIEAALERVRSRTMGMQKSDELKEVIQLVYEQLKQLNFNIDSANFALDYKESDDFNLWLSSAGQLYPTKVHTPYVDLPIFNRFIEAKANGFDFLTENYSFEEKNAFFDHFFKNVQGVTDERKEFVMNTAGYARSTVLMKNVTLSMQNYAAIPYSEEENAALRRFGKVFEQTYTRFLDLQQAEAQAREAKIEAGLERVRAKAMSMQTSEELNELIGTVFGELTKLDFVLTRCLIMIFDPETNSSRWWMANSEAPSEPMNYLVQYHKYPAYAAFLKAWKERVLKWRYALKGKVKKDWDDFLFVETELSLLPDFVIAGMKAPEQVLLSVSFNNFGCLTLATLEPLSDEHSDIMLRFAKVFDMSYTRFNDLKQAEAQAKEAQIQLALERVRARTMAMQKSEELAETATVLFQQLLDLGISSERTFIGMPNDDTRKIELWGTEQGGNQMSMRFEYEADATYAFREIYKAWQEKKSELTVILKGKNLDEHINYVRNVLHMPLLPGLVQKQRMLYNAFFSKGLLMIVTPDTQSKETLEILERFAGVFDGTYTRFLDLQKAEAQGRESQIQLALERVRARTMAMQKSDELVETAMTLFQQFSDLGVKPERIFIGNMDENTRMIEFWGTDLGGEHPRFEVNTDATIGFSQIYKAWKAKKKTHKVIMKGQELADHLRYVQDVLHMPMQPELVQRQRIMYSAFFSKGLLMIITPEIQSNETLGILERFAGVFDGTYTRFLDLQKAEAQARESQIQLALERVRARTMAMQKSEELAETATVLFQQLLNLGISAERTIIGIPNEDTRKIEFWGTEQGGNQINTRFEYEADATYAFREIYKGWQEKRSELTVILKGKNLEEHVNYARNVLHMPLLIGLVQQQRILYNAFFSKGWLGIVTPDIQSKETLEILQRFAGVFDGTYTRFLDLKKAEAQAREAQIELALERVRARAMAMRDSKELSDMVSTVFGELTKLDFALTRCAIVIADSESRGRMIWMANSEAGQPPISFYRKSLDHPYPNAAAEEWKKRTPKWVYHLKGAEKQAMDDYYANSEEVAHIPSVIKQAMDMPESIILSHSFNNFGYLRADSLEPLSEANLDILYRFAKVFDLGYTRFTDIKQAEAQAREAQIELALERVRSRTMAMFKSDELAETAVILFQQLDILGISPDRVFIGIFMEDTGEMECWATDQVGHQISNRFIAKLQQPSFAKIYTVWKTQEKSFSLVQTGKELEDYINYFRYELGLPFKPALIHDKRVQNVAFFSNGLIGFTTADIPPPGIINILERFAGVFNLTYTRFLDLQKAEAQAREAKIEVALERVRSRTMAMFKSDELAGTSVEVFKQLIGLGIQPNRLFIGIINDDSGDIELWATNEDGTQISTKFTGNINQNHSIKKMYAGWKAQKRSITIDMQGKELKEYFRYLKDELNVPFKLGLSQKRRIQLIAYFSQGFIGMASPEPQPETTTNLLERFAGVFNLTYTRFRDLQRAEAQAKDAKIEASLERVRSKTMAMHNSNDVGETVAVMFDELVKLGVETTSRLGILIVDNTSHMEVWTASADAQGKTSMRIGRLDMTIHPILQGLHTAWKNKETVFSYPLAGEDMKAYYRAINNSPDYPSQFNLDNLPKRQEHNSFIFPEGAIFIFSLQPLTTEITQIFKKFAGVFGQTYRRYLDLQKAETQARESQIEASLERVRGKALAMYNSKDLSSTASLVFTELRKLGVNSKRCGVALLSKNSRHTQLYVATTTLDTDSLDLVGAIELSGHPSLEKQYESWLKNEDYFTVLKGEELKSYKELIYSMLPVPYDHSYHEEFGSYLAFSEGFLFSWAERPFSEVEINILNRFKTIIDLTFRRYIELQKSEANAREAIRQSSLDRVRAEIASMRTTGDLDSITPLIWNELTTLGVPFIRCGVFIMDEPLQLIHTYLSTPDGKAIAAFQLHFNADTGNGVNGVALQGWRQKQAVTLHWTEEEFRTFTHSLVEQGEITSEENYLTEHPPTGLDLHFFPFLQGMLYAGNTEPLSDDDKDLVQSLADAFSTAYARYEDFNRLELAKQQVEHTLSDLKSAQTKLVQSEKMASLGELTAGIAHEIQNPLNFVNNFSEVNQEMIEELEEELNAGNIQEALALAADIKQNEQKINHHGKRADGIVKGMLEHSRTGGGEKMPINMNALADEFMRLSYHGLRAKDKAFNAEMVTNFDPELPKINVVGQDMGRVILNLFNNAFYAVNQKKKTAEAGYKPEVSVTTAAENGRVVIKVKDNGIGIPDAIKEKIMQPFFTTKPTGEGTGLGLSLTYDMVVKGHGGSITVNSVEGEGSEFIIQLPTN